MVLYFRRASEQALKRQIDEWKDKFPYTATKDEQNAFVRNTSYQLFLETEEYLQARESPLIKNRTTPELYLQFEDRIHRAITTDIDGTLFKIEALMRLLKRLGECQNVDLRQGLADYGKARAEYSALIMSNKKNPSLIVRHLANLQTTLRKPLSASVHDLPLETAVDVAAEHAMLLMKQDANPGLFEFAERMKAQGYSLWGVTQNFSFFYMLPMHAIGFDYVIGNRIPAVKDGKIIFEENSPTRIVTSANKSNIISKGIKYIAEILRRENFSKSDMTKDEQEGFSRVFDRVKHPRMGISRPYYMDSRDERQQDFWIFTTMPHVKREFAGGILVGSEDESEIVNELRTDNFKDLVQVSDVLLRRDNWLRGVHLSKGFAQHVADFRKAAEGKKDFSNKQEEDVYSELAQSTDAQRTVTDAEKELERKRIAVEFLDMLAAEHGLDVNPGEIVFGKHEAIIYKTNGNPIRLDDAKVRSRLMKPSRKKVGADIAMQRRIFPDVDGTAECLVELIQAFEQMPVEVKHDFVSGMNE